MSDVPGLDHPLTRASTALDATVRQLLVVGGIFAGSVAAAAERVTWARSLGMASAVVLLGFATAALIRRQTRRDHALDLIVAGRENIPVSVVQRQCRRLSRPKTRQRLARALDSMIEDALRPGPLPPSSRPLFHRPSIALLQSELRTLAELLRSGEASVRGVAFCERLVMNGCSPLYGEDPVALRTELGRARALLELA